MHDAFSSCCRALYLALASSVVLLIVVGSFLFAGTAFAQGEGEQNCVQCGQTVGPLTDLTCTSPANCTATTGCVSQTFTAACTGNYAVTSWLACEGGATCDDNNSCVNVYDDSGTRVGGCHNLTCSNCSNNCTVCLVAGKQYTLYACLTTCDGTGSCPVVSCKANGKLYYCGPFNTSCP